MNWRAIGFVSLLVGAHASLAETQVMRGKGVAVVGADTLQDAEFRPPEELRKKFLQGFEADLKGTMRAGLAGMLSEKADPAVKNWLVTRAEAQDPKMALGL